MKGYLQRLAASVARPAPALHPLVGSLFGATPPGAFAGDGARDEGETTAAASAPSPVAPMQRFAPLRSGPVAELPFDGSPNESLLAPAPARADLGDEPAPVVPPTAFVRPDSALADTQGPREAPAQSMEPTILLAAPETPEPARLVPAWQSHEPQPAPARMSELRTLPVATPPATPPHEPLRRAAPAAGALHRTSAAAPPEIQIHIGRVEVVATAPAPVRPAGPPARRATSLDDYLKRHNGGSR